MELVRVPRDEPGQLERLHGLAPDAHQLAQIRERQSTPPPASTRSARRGRRAGRRGHGRSGGRRQQSWAANSRYRARGAGRGGQEQKRRPTTAVIPSVERGTWAGGATGTCFVAPPAQVPRSTLLRNLLCFTRVLGSLRFNRNEGHAEAPGAFGESHQIALSVNGVVIVRATVRVSSAGSKRVVDPMG